MVQCTRDWVKTGGQPTFWLAVHVIALMIVSFLFSIRMQSDPEKMKEFLLWTHETSVLALVIAAYPISISILRFRSQTRPLSETTLNRVMMSPVLVLTLNGMSVYNLRVMSAETKIDKLVLLAFSALTVLLTMNYAVSLHRAIFSTLASKDSD